MGRESFLLPVTWEDEWPVIADGRSHLEWEAPLTSPQLPLCGWTADLKRIEPRWLFLRQPDESRYICSEDGLTLIPAGKISSETGSPTMMLVRPLDIHFTLEAEMAFDLCEDGDEAGVVMYISCYGYYTVGVKMLDGQRVIAVTRSGGGPVPHPFPAPEGRVTFRIQAEKDCCHFSIAGEDGVFCPVVTRPVFGRSEAGKCFTGTLFGVYAQHTAETQAQARLLRFEMQP